MPASPLTSLPRMQMSPLAVSKALLKGDFPFVMLARQAAKLENLVRVITTITFYLEN